MRISDWSSDVCSSDLWLALPEPPDAICTIYDAGAIQLMEILKERGIQVPTDIAVTGFGNDPAACLLVPGLTTYEQKLYEIGLVAGKKMLDLVKKRFTDVTSEITISTGRLVVRGSSEHLSTGKIGRAHV